MSILPDPVPTSTPWKHLAARRLQEERLIDMCRLLSQSANWDMENRDDDEHRKGATMKLRDLRHSEKESRFLRLGRAVTGRVLVVAYTVRRRDDGESVRIISARRASRTERAAYAGAARD